MHKEKKTGKRITVRVSDRIFKWLQKIAEEKSGNITTVVNDILYDEMRKDIKK